MTINLRTGERYAHDFDRVRGAFLENCDAQLAELGSAAHE